MAVPRETREEERVRVLHRNLTLTLEMFLSFAFPTFLSVSPSPFPVFLDSFFQGRYPEVGEEIIYRGWMRELKPTEMGMGLSLPRMYVI